MLRAAERQVHNRCHLAVRWNIRLLATGRLEAGLEQQGTTMIGRTIALAAAVALATPAASQNINQPLPSEFAGRWCYDSVRSGGENLPLVFVFRRARTECPHRTDKYDIGPVTITRERYENSVDRCKFLDAVPTSRGTQLWSRFYCRSKADDANPRIIDYRMWVDGGKLNMHELSRSDQPHVHQ